MRSVRVMETVFLLHFAALLIPAPTHRLVLVGSRYIQITVIMTLNVNRSVASLADAVILLNVIIHAHRILNAHLLHAVQKESAQTLKYAKEISF